MNKSELKKRIKELIAKSKEVEKQNIFRDEDLSQRELSYCWHHGYRQALYTILEELD